MQVILKPLYHRGQSCIGIYFEKNAAIQSAIQKQAGCKWSKTNSCWYMPCIGENYLRLKSALENKAELEISELKKFLLEKRKVNSESNTSEVKVANFSKVGNLQKVGHPDKPANTHFQKVNRVEKPGRVSIRISKENREALEKYRQMLTLKSYSPSTIRTYINEFTQFLNTIKANPASGFTTERVKDYMQYCCEKLKLSENTLHSRINALKFYFEQVYPVGLKKYQDVLLCLCIIK